MKIKKQLKYYSFEINEETKELSIWDMREIGTYPDKVTLNKTYTFSLARFLIRYFFRLSVKRRNK
jgi:hypothetical protein